MVLITLLLVQSLFTTSTKSFSIRHILLFILISSPSFIRIQHQAAARPLPLSLLFASPLPQFWLFWFLLFYSFETISETSSKQNSNQKAQNSAKLHLWATSHLICLLTLKKIHLQVTLMMINTLVCNFEIIYFVLKRFNKIIFNENYESHNFHKILDNGLRISSYFLRYLISEFYLIWGGGLDTTLLLNFILWIPLSKWNEVHVHLEEQFKFNLKRTSLSIESINCKNKWYTF